MINFQFSIFNFQKILFIGLLVYWFIGVPQAAAADFTTDYNITYNVSETGKARVTQEITLTNHTVTLYPADYTLTVQGGSVENVGASDELGKMKVGVSKTNSDSAIKVSFNKKAVGQGSKVSWTLSYDVSEFAVKRGRIWELTVPKIAETSDIGNYHVTLKVPKEFGPEHYITPEPNSVEHTEDRWVYLFSNHKPQTTNHKPISAAFGDYQLFSFKLVYHLQNPESFAAITEIALPPDLPAQAGLLPYQKIYYRSLDPQPGRIYQDADGNYLASYKLAAKEKLDIVFAGAAKVISNIKYQPTTNHQLPTSFQPYLLPAKYWEVNAEEIQDLLREIVETKNNLTVKQLNNYPNCQMVKSFNCYEPLSLTQAIYNYVVTNLKYDPARMNKEVERLGAVKALEHKDSAVCMEFTDLLITLMRAAGIPAREIDGFAYTPEEEKKTGASDTLHSWVQIFFPDVGWLNIDPTWGATTGVDYFTKLDTNHLAFVIKGIDSEKPYPAGSYKIEGTEKGDVEVSFAEKFSPDVIPFRLWWENWERENEKVDWLTALFRLFARI